METQGNAKIRVRGLDVWYGEKKVLKDVSLEIADRKVLGIIGPSGCGKSTFLRTLNRMAELYGNCHFEGDVSVDGKNILDWDVVDLRRKVGMVFQHSNPFPKSIYENVVYGLRVAGEKRRSRLQEIAEQRQLHGFEE